MNYERERYVRLYTRETPTTKAIGWEGRAVLHELLRKVDRTGRIELENFDAVEGICFLTDQPAEVVRVGLQRLAQRGTIVLDEGGLYLPNFEYAQEWTAGNAERCRKYRAKRRGDVSPDMLDTVKRHADHVATQNDTPSLPIPSLPVKPPPPAVAPPAGESLELVLEVAPASSVRPKAERRKPRTACPASVEPVDSWAAEWGVPMDHPEFGKFIDHHRKLGNLFADWAAAWRTWLARAPDFAARGSPRTLLQPEAKPGEFDWRTRARSNRI